MLAVFCISQHKLYFTVPWDKPGRKTSGRVPQPRVNVLYLVDVTLWRWHRSHDVNSTLNSKPLGIVLFASIIYVRQ